MNRDDLADALALVEASHRADDEGIRCLLDNCDLEGTAQALAVICAGVVGDVAAWLDQPPPVLYEQMRAFYAPEPPRA